MHGVYVTGFLQGILVSWDLVVLLRVKFPPHPLRATKINVSLLCDTSRPAEDSGHFVLAQAWGCITQIKPLRAGGPKPVEGCCVLTVHVADFAVLDC